MEILTVLRRGGSVLEDGDGDLASDALLRAETLPIDLFRPLDESWRDYARSLTNHPDIVLPPLLSILLNRSNGRDAIPDVLTSLRDEWAGAREKVWLSLDALRAANSLQEANAIRRELAEAFKLFAPVNGDSFSPQRTLWEFGKGAVTGGITAAILGGGLGGVVTTALATGATNAIPSVVDPLRLLNTSGAFDLARRVRLDLRTIEPGLLSRLLTKAEKQRRLRRSILPEGG